MLKHHQRRLIFHSSIILFVGLVCGILALPEEIVGDTFQGWSRAQAFLLASGLWVLAMTSALPLLKLEQLEMKALIGCLIATGYGFLLACSFEAMLGARALNPGGPVLNLVGFAGNLVGVFGASMGVLLTLLGAQKALREADPNAEEEPGPSSRLAQDPT